MAVRHFSSTGTRASGNSTPGDWTDANCYNWSGIKANGMNWGMATGDSVILNDEAFVIDFLQTAASQATTGATLTVQSKSGDPGLCSVACNGATGSLWRFNHASKVLSALVSGITFSKSVTHTDASASMVHVTSVTSGDVEFSNCVFDGVTNAYTNAGLNGHFSISDGVAATLRFTNTQILNMTSSHLSGRYFGYVGSSATMVFSGCSISNVTHNTTGTAHHCTGGVYSAGQLQVFDCSLADCSNDSATDGEYANEPLFHAIGPCTIAGLTSTNVTNTGAKAGAAIATFEDAYSVSDTFSVDCVSTPSFINGVDGDRQNSVGGTFTAFGSSAQGTADRIRAIRCTGDFGSTFYFSQGAGGTITDLISEYCTARKEGAGVYAGGWGDVTVDGFRVVGATTGLETIGFEGWGGAMYGHNHTNSTRDKTTRFLNGVISGCSQLQGGDAGIRVRGLHATYAHNVEISNVVVDNPGHTSQIGLHESASCALNVSGSGNAIMGGTQGLTLVKLGVGVDSYSSPAAIASTTRPVKWGVSNNASVSRAGA